MPVTHELRAEQHAGDNVVVGQVDERENPLWQVGQQHDADDGETFGQLQRGERVRGAEALCPECGERNRNAVPLLIVEEAEARKPQRREARGSA